MEYGRMESPGQFLFDSGPECMRVEGKTAAGYKRLAKQPQPTPHSLYPVKSLRKKILLTLHQSAQSPAQCSLDTTGPNLKSPPSVTAFLATSSSSLC